MNKQTYGEGASRFQQWTIDGAGICGLIAIPVGMYGLLFYGAALGASFNY